MKDELIDLLRDRFSRHELEVPDTVWENVSGQLAASASGEGLREALQKKFQAHEVEVDPSAWANISAQLGHGAAAGSGFSTTWIAAGITAVVITAGAVLWNTRETPAPLATAPIEAVTLEPVATAPVATKAGPEPASIALVAPAKQKPAPAKKTTNKSHSPAETPQPVQPTPASAPTGPVDATPPVVNAATSGNADAAPAAQPAAPKPQAPSTGTAEEATMDGMPPAPVASTAPAPSAAAPPADRPSPAPSTVPSAAPSAPADNFHLFIPNVLTPNGDGVNDNLTITAGEHLNALVRIIAMNGSLVFQTSDLAQEWDGLLPNGNIAEEGYYNCIVQITDLTGKSHIKKEVIRLYR
jgi:gliding motility-associated-like protein